MKTQYCEQEQAVIAATQAGTLPHDLLAHVGGCPVCSEVLLVSEGLREDAALANDQPHPPDPGVIWRKAQARAREQALARATLPIRIVRTCAYALAILASPWLVLQISHPPAWMPNLGFNHFPWMQMDGNWLAALSGTTLLGLTATLVCISLSSWYMLREK
jgi:hypothetical protein